MCADNNNMTVDSSIWLLYDEQLQHATVFTNVCGLRWHHNVENDGGMVAAHTAIRIIWQN